MKLLHNFLGVLCAFALMITLLITSVEAVTYWTPGYYEKNTPNITSWRMSKWRWTTCWTLPMR